ncbi:hypothetical protein RCH12_003732 [Cryobacterium sp. MP_3.1]|uniref:hypothetical protein n=1 Tax=Cryobacterium sp. MP_3.1 TaxID=3071711 RepID=UPI002DF953A4|nr:hypothetical protein [Cryobacterium sp. MP_3.1]
MVRESFFEKDGYFPFQGEAIGPTFRTVGGESVSAPMIVPDGKSGLWCENCAPNHYLTVGDTVQKETCSVSGQGASFLRPPAMQEADLALTAVTSVGALSERQWWHFSTISNWPGTFNGIVHVGSLLSALARTGSGNTSQRLEPITDGHGLAAWWFHRVELAESLTVDPTVYVEMPGDLWEPHRDKLVRSNHVVRYVNRQENSGSICLALNSTDLIVVDSVPVILDSILSDSLVTLREKKNYSR